MEPRDLMADLGVVATNSQHLFRHHNLYVLTTRAAT